MDRNHYKTAGGTILALASLFFVFFFSVPTAHAGDLIYSNTATTSTFTSNRFQTVIDCDVLDSSISEFRFFFSDRGVVSTSTLSIDSVDYGTYVHPVNTTQQWHTVVLTSDFDCTAGQGQVLVQMAGSASGGSYSVRGTGGFNTTQVSGTIFGTNGITTSTTTVKVALMIYSGDTIVPPRVFSFPEPVFQGKIRVATTTCTNDDVSSECVTLYTPEYYYHDWLLVQMMIIFLLSFIPLGFFFNRVHSK